MGQNISMIVIWNLHMLLYTFVYVSTDINMIKYKLLPEQLHYMWKNELSKSRWNYWQHAGITATLSPPAPHSTHRLRCHWSEHVTNTKSLQYWFQPLPPYMKTTSVTNQHWHQKYECQLWCHTITNAFLEHFASSVICFVVLSLVLQVTMKVCLMLTCSPIINC